ncbi:tyrosine-sulfated glycopeptide receptor 1-like [Miscanthus floridulus]|uniref:tyrosine-sulfated glycopeptide receptor 1-like n=1 Tax=Miscanthus floridulus TaxID=154761 RepID=UPI0034577CEF
MQSLHFSYKKYRSRLPIPVLVIALVLLISLSTPTSSCTEQEKTSLLQFLAGLSKDSGLAKSWKEEGTDCCKWQGITCNGNKAVTEVSLPCRDLEGSIGLSLGNLTDLQYLNLSYNSLSGGLPLGLVSSSSIIVLDVSFNQLSGDLIELSASTPGQPLQVLNISSNLFTGQFTSTTWKGMENLAVLNASNNSFTGLIPSHFCNISPSFAVLELCYNQFSGRVPPGLGNCSMLRVFKAGQNNLSGALPDDIFNATSLEYLSLPSNELQGALDGSHITNLKNLTTLNLGGNNFSSSIPDSIGQLKRLQELHLDHNSMTGELPSTLSSCTDLITIDLKSNSFSGDLVKVNFSTLKNLRTLDLLYNTFTGTIPESIYSCTNLTALRLSGNKLHGQLSQKIVNLKSLTFLSIGENNFTNVTNTLQILKRFRNLTTLLMGSSFMGESIPEDETIHGFHNLQFLSMANSSLCGTIPLWLSKLTTLQILDLSGNQLTGPIPAWINRLKFLFYLDISNNSFIGEIPKSLMQMQMLTSKNTAAHFDPGILELPVYQGQSLQYHGIRAFPTVLNLASNNFTGAIPQEIGQLKMLLSLNISHNNLFKQIPQSICNLTDLEVLDLSNNHLTGAIPVALNNLHFLSQFSVANNDLEGPIPTGGQFSTFPISSFEGNPKLCGSILFRSCGSTGALPVSTKQHNKKIAFAIAFGVFFGAVIILLLLVCFLISTKGTTSIRKDTSTATEDVGASRSNTEQPFVILPQRKGEGSNFTFIDIVKATNKFDKENIIGCGGYGLVYKAELPDGSKLAIKKLNGEMCLMEREFTAEVDALSMAQHENLVPLWGYCIQGNSRFLIYSLMENGNLDDWLHNSDDDTSTSLDWLTRLRIAQGASRGLSYIHNVCKPHIVHRDIKSSNILLDKEFKAYVADFGLSRLILPNKTHVTTELVGTLGYIPPEYGQGWVATLRGDIYSFGVVLLELLTGLRPVPVLSTSKELVPWVLEMRSQGKQIEVLDPTLRGTGHEEQMLMMLEGACKCVNHNPVMRPSIMEVVSCLESIDAGLPTQKSAKT